jgi:mRNA interferase MazF
VVQIRRGDIYRARLDPTEGSEQAGNRPVIVVSRDALNDSSPVIVVVPVTDRKNKRTIYPSQAVIPAGDGGLAIDSVALGEQVRAVTKTRLTSFVGHLSVKSIAAIGTALKITLDLP